MDAMGHINIVSLNLQVDKFFVSGVWSGTIRPVTMKWWNCKCNKLLTNLKSRYPQKSSHTVDGGNPAPVGFYMFYTSQVVPWTRTMYSKCSNPYCTNILGEEEPGKKSFPIKNPSLQGIYEWFLMSVYTGKASQHLPPIEPGFQGTSTHRLISVPNRRMISCITVTLKLTVHLWK